MADIDDELLALAGTDEDSGTEREPSRSPGAVSGKRGEARPGASSATSTAAKNVQKRKQDDSDEEEGEAISEPGTPNSLESAPMEESDSETEQPPQRPGLNAVVAAATASASAAGRDDGDKYPVDGLYTSLVEKEEISRMREVERERILAERREEAQLYKQNRMLRQLVSAAEEKEKEKEQLRGTGRKRTAHEADLGGAGGEDNDDDEDDDGDYAGSGRKPPSRQRVKVAEGSGIDTLRRQRAEKNDQRRRREEDREKEKLTPRKPGQARLQDSFAGGADEDEDWTRQKTPEVEKRGTPDADLADFQRLRIGRADFPEICFKPNFEKVATDCYVRVIVKSPSQGQQEKYSIVSIKSFTTGRGYSLNYKEGGLEKQITLDMYFVAGIGKRTEVYPFIAASNGKIMQEEVDEYKRLLQDRDIPFLKRSTATAKLDELHGLLNYKLTNQEITDMVERKTKMRNKFDPVIRAQLERSIQEELASGNANPIYARQLQEQLESLGQPSNLAFRNQQGGGRSGGGGGGGKGKNSLEQQRLAELNAENRRRNADNVRKAQLQERHRQRDKELRAARGEAVDDDPSRRVRTRAKFVHDPNQTNTPKGSRPGSGASTPANGTPKLGPTSGGLRKGLPEVARLQEKKFQESKGVPTIHKELDDDEIIGSLDLDIDVDID